MVSARRWMPACDGAVDEWLCKQKLPCIYLIQIDNLFTPFNLASNPQTVFSRVAFSGSMLEDS